VALSYFIGGAGRLGITYWVSSKETWSLINLAYFLRLLHTHFKRLGREKKPAIIASLSLKLLFYGFVI
jgi:hypothetical protein